MLSLSKHEAAQTYDFICRAVSCFDGLSMRGAPLKTVLALSLSKGESPRTRKSARTHNLTSIVA